MQKRAVHAVLFAFVILILSSASFAQLRISVSFGPPALPVYEQPLCPGEGYLWTPGFWAWDADYNDYYWVPGTWVLPPQPEILWTPPYWAWVDGAFVFYDGYWGPQVGFYGGIDYGFGYFGDGFVGGRWDRGHFFYNRSVTNINVTEIHNVYNTTVINTSTRTNRVSFNGGNGGVNRRPTPQEEAASRERHIPPASTQLQHLQAARGNQEFRASTNHGKPPVAATARPAQFSGRDAVPAREAGAQYNPPANRGVNPPRNENANPPRNENGNRPSTFSHPSELPPMEHPSAPNTGNSKLDKRYQQQEQKLQQKQEQARQKLQQQQEKDHQQMMKRNADEARKQQTEQRHQQQTQQLQQRQTQEQQRMQQRQAPPPQRSEQKPPKDR
jgi:WXXGXW repeat (2 copies)